MQVHVLGAVVAIATVAVGVSMVPAHGHLSLPQGGKEEERYNQGLVSRVETALIKPQPMPLGRGKQGGPCTALGAVGCLPIPEMVLGWQDREELEEEVRTRVAVEVRTILERMETSWQVASCACLGMSCVLRALFGAACTMEPRKMSQIVALAVHSLK